MSESNTNTPQGWGSVETGLGSLYQAPDSPLSPRCPDGGCACGCARAILEVRCSGGWFTPVTKALRAERALTLCVKAAVTRPDREWRVVCARTGNTIAA